MTSNITHADAIADLCARLTPQGKAKLAVPCEQLKPDGHELAQTFLKPLAAHGPFSAEMIKTNATEHQAFNKSRSAQLMQHQVELLEDAYGPQDVGTPINWHTAPKDDWQWPTHLSRHYYLMPLGYAYRATGRQSAVLLPDSRGRRMCWVMAGISLARRTVAAAFDAFGGWCFVDGEALAVQISGQLAVESERGQYRLAGHDARNVKSQDLTPNTRVLPPRADPFCLLLPRTEALPRRAFGHEAVKSGRKTLVACWRGR